MLNVCKKDDFWFSFCRHLTGGMDLGLERAGMSCSWQVEINEFCTKVLNKHWPNVPKFGDIRGFTIDTSVNLLYNQLTDEKKEIINMGAKRKDYDLAVELYNKGMSIGDVSDYYSISRQAMWMILKRRNCEFRPQKRYGEDNDFYRGGEISDSKVHDLFEAALKKGIIKRIYKCEECESTEQFIDGRTAIQAHHDNYNKPLDVKWLCQKCHFEWHKKNRAIKREEVKNSEVTEEIPTIDVVVGGFP